MKPKSKVTKASPIAPLLAQVRLLIQSARRAAAGAVNLLQVATNFEIGRNIVEHEQQGRERAEYGAQLLEELAERLTAEFGRGFSRSNLQNMRAFYLTYQDRLMRIRQKASGELPSSPSRSSGKGRALRIRQKASGESFSIFEPETREIAAAFQVSWSHYVELLSVENPAERSFYEIEAASSGWSLPELKRQISSCLYERLALSRDKKRIHKLAAKGHTIKEPADILRSPVVLEFLGLEERPSYSETDLETAIIDKLQHFLLELGKGFLFESRQKRFTFDTDNYYVDLVFYNRLLRCYVLFDLKLDKLTHEDLGQMQMYVNYYDREVKTRQENPTIGILLCKRKKDALIELTLPEDANIYASQYSLYLPSKKDLQKRLMQWTAEQEAGR